MTQKKKICFISLGNLYLCPYIEKYISLLEHDYDVIYWDRHQVKEDINASEIYRFNYEMQENTGKFKKALGYAKFRRFASKLIKRNNYDGIIILQTSVGILLQSCLMKNYRFKYILDIRDYTMENNFLFYNLVKKLIKNSNFTAISSKGYESFLPKDDYTLVHNDIEISSFIMKKFKEKERYEEKITVSYIGLIRFHEENKKAILRFKNDDRFILKFVGKDALILKEFCLENDVQNVELIDRFPPEKTLEHYYKTDIIYNLYGNNSPILDYALSNKLYYALKLTMPILISPNTFMEKVSKEYGIGHVMDLEDPNACNDLYKFYTEIDWIKFAQNCSKSLVEIDKENTFFEKKVKNYIHNL